MSYTCLMTDPRHTWWKQHSHETCPDCGQLWVMHHAAQDCFPDIPKDETMPFPFKTHGPQRGPCPHESRRRGPCFMERGHVGACETQPEGDCKHGHQWYPVGPRERPYTVEENAAYHGIVL